MEESLEDALTGLPEEMRTRIAELTEGVPDDLVDEIVYGYLVERCGGLTKEQLLAVDLGKYDRLRTFVSNDEVDWQLARNRLLFLQTAVRVGISWPEISSRTVPYFGRAVEPPFEAICQALEPAAYQP